MTTNTSKTIPYDADPLLARLRAQAQQAGGGGLLFVIGGAAITLFALVWPSGIVAFVTGGYLNFWVCYAIGVACVVPWIIRQIQRDKVVYGGDAGLSEPGMNERASSYGEYEMRMFRLEWGVLLEWLLFGPRLLIEGIEQTQGMQSLRNQHMLVRSARMLRDLAAVGQATASKSLLHGDETTQDIDYLIRYLDRNDWVGASSDHKRVWLSSKAMTELPSLGVPIRRE